MSNAKYIAILVVVGVVIIVGAVMLGKSDNGEINVNATINSANQANTEAGNNNPTVNTTPNALRGLPNGGLVPQDPNARPQPPTPESEAIDENASTTTATTTEEGVTEEAEAGDSEALDTEIPEETTQ